MICMNLSACFNFLVVAMLTVQVVYGLNTYYNNNIFIIIIIIIIIAFVVAFVVVLIAVIILILFTYLSYLLTLLLEISWLIN